MWSFGRTAAIVSVLIATLGVAPASLLQREPPPDRGPGLLGFYDGMLLEPEQRISVRAPEDVEAVEFWLEPARGRPVLLGVDRDGREATFGPHCEESPCLITGEFSVAIGRDMRRVPEGDATVRVREVGAREDFASAVVYWDGTPPVATFRSPRFNAPLRGRHWDVVAHTLDENVVSIVVKWMPVPLASLRNIPRYEQHEHGSALGQGGHWSCVPTAVGANLQWLDDTLQWTSIPGLCGNNNFACVTGLLGLYMDTNVGGNGTTQGGLEQGTVDFLADAFGYQPGVDYTVEYPAGEASLGISPEQVIEAWAAGAAVAVIFFSLPGESSWGHMLTLDAVSPNSDGTVWIRVMDPHVDPPAKQGEYRWFLLQKNGTIAWDPAKTGYYSPSLGLVRLIGMQVIDDFFFFTDLGASAAATASAPAQVDGGEVPGSMRGDRTWVGRFEPPRGAEGPFLLVSETRDASGRMLRDYQLVGGFTGSPPRDER